MAKSTAETLAQRCARPSATGSSRTMPRRWTTKIIVGKATPKQARMMCQPSETAICSRAGISPAGTSAVSRLEQGGQGGGRGEHGFDGTSVRAAARGVSA